MQAQVTLWPGVCGGGWGVRARVGIDVGVNREPLKVSSCSVPERGEAVGPGRGKSVLDHRLCSAQRRVFLVLFSFPPLPAPPLGGPGQGSPAFCVSVYLKGTLSSFEHKELIP